MTNRERVRAILHYEDYDRMPVVSFGYWGQTLEKWADEGHITREHAEQYAKYGDNSEADREVMRLLGFDFNWNSCFGFAADLFPQFEAEVLEETEDGQRIMRDPNGLIVKIKPGIISIPSEIGTSLTGREAWEKLYLPRLKYTRDRIDFKALEALKDDSDRDIPVGLFCGSYIGKVRDLLGVEHLSYLYADDEELYTEIIDTIAGISYQAVKDILATGAKFDYAHFWEDICFKNGPLVSPSVLREKVGPHYRRTTELLALHGVDIVSLDCDGCIDALVPIWLENGVNTMFPIEVGTWRASIAPWRSAYGYALRGVGGMDKRVFALDYAAVDAEIERLAALVELGGYIPCPDHRIPPDAKWENVQYYCDRFRKRMERAR